MKIPDCVWVLVIDDGFPESPYVTAHETQKEALDQKESLTIDGSTVEGPFRARLMEADNG